MKVGDVVTFVGAPEMPMAVCDTYSETRVVCGWLRDGAYQCAPLPIACLTVVRPADPEERLSTKLLLGRVARLAENVEAAVDSSTPALALKLTLASLHCILEDWRAK